MPSGPPVSSQKARMLAGELYDAADPELAAERQRARALCLQLNALAAAGADERRAVVQALLGKPCNATITPPFQCDYGLHLTLGDGAYLNVDCVVLDVCAVTIGARTLLGPGVHVYAATHPMDAATRASGLEAGAPVVIGADVWIGGGTIVCPGVTIGDGSVVGAGSVVTRDVPAGVFAAGNPCRVIRAL